MQHLADLLNASWNFNLLQAFAEMKRSIANSLQAASICKSYTMNFALHEAFVRNGLNSSWDHDLPQVAFTEDTGSE